MKKVLILILLLSLITSACSSHKEYLSFAQKGKYGKFPTKKNKPMKQHYYWTFAQWGR
jgi:thioredoxin-related protein